MTDEQLSGPQKAAIFLYSIGEELASAVVKQLDEEEIKRLGSSLSKISSVSPQVTESILSEFQQLAASPLLGRIDRPPGNQFIKNVLSRAVESEKAETILKDIQQGEKWNLFQKIRRLDARTVATFIRNEHPQTIAIILAHLDSDQSAGILEELPELLQTDVVYRIAELENIPPGIIEEIDQALQEQIAMVGGSEGHQQGGLGLVADILNKMDSSMESNILKGIEEQKQGLAEEIRQLMFVFEDLYQVDDRSVMTILKEVNNETLIVALKTASEELKEKIFKNMSERAAQMMKEDMDVMAPVRLKDVETAQQTILRIAKKLESEGKIVLISRGKEEVFV